MLKRSEEFGYITSNPELVGTGMRVSVIAKLPQLLAKSGGELDQVGALETCEAGGLRAVPLVFQGSCRSRCKEAWLSLLLQVLGLFICTPAVTAHPDSQLSPDRCSSAPATCSHLPTPPPLSP